MKRGKTKAIKVFQQTMDELARAMTIADATPSLRDNLKLLKRELQLVDDEIKVEGKTKDLLDQRAQITADITTTQREITQNQQKSAKEATKQAKATKRATRQRRGTRSSSRRSVSLRPVSRSPRASPRYPGA